MVLLPNLGRDATALATLQVGVAPTGQRRWRSPPIRTCFQLDGGNNSGRHVGQLRNLCAERRVYRSAASGGTPSGVIPTPVESIEEFKVGTANQTADFNGAAGSQVQMVTKRGTNQFSRGAV